MKTMRKLFMLAIAMVTAFALGQPGPVSPPVTQILAGAGISLSPTSGIGNVTISSSGGGGTPGGSSGDWQYNNSGAFGGFTPASGAQTFIVTPTSANLRALLTDETGTGAAYFVGGALGTPASGTGTNITGIPAANILSGTLATGMAAATGSVGAGGTNIATQAYVDASVADDIEIKNPVVAATNAALLFSPSYSNGSSGVGATLTGGIGVLIVDGYTPVLNDRILVKNEASTLTQGVYTVTRLGTVSIGYILTRALDFNQAANVLYGDSVGVLQGTVNANQQFTMNNQNAITVGTTAITFAQTSGGSQLTSGTGITITGNSVAMATSAAMPGSPTVAGTASTAAGGIVTTDGTQTLTNKTLTAPAETNPTVTGTFTIGGSSAATVDFPNAGDTSFTSTGGGAINFAQTLRFNGAIKDTSGSAGSSTDLFTSTSTGVAYRRAPTMCITFIGGTGNSVTVNTSAAFLFSSGHRNRVGVNLKGYTKARVSVGMGSAAPVANTVIGFRYYTTGTDSTFADYIQMGASSTDVSVTCAATSEATFLGSWVNLTANTINDTDIYIVPFSSAPSGSTTLSIVELQLEVQ